MNSSSPRNPSTSAKNTVSGSGLRQCFGPEGCPAVSNGRRCGETRNLEIIQEFRRLYENKMKQIDDVAGGDCVQAKINLQQEWIRDLTEQNEMLVRVVEELEVEAAERVTMLEDRLQQSAKCACEVMGSYRDFSINFLADFQKLEYVQNDLNNLIELLRRTKRQGTWNTKDLRFYTINIDEVIDGNSSLIKINNNKESDCNCVWDGGTSANCKNERLMKDKEKKLRDLEDKIKKLNEAADKNDDTKKTCQELQKSMLDMRDALTAEVAEKHNVILCLRREVRMLEEQCNKADQQSHFKDDIIKELRKEIKQLKLQVQELEDYEKKHRDSMEKLETLRGELDKYKSENNSSLTKVKTLSDENRSQAETIASLKERLKKSSEKRSTTSTGVSVKTHSKDTGVDPHVPPTKHVGVGHVPDTKTVGTASDIENQIIPSYLFEHHTPPRNLRTIACETYQRPRELTYEQGPVICVTPDTFSARDDNVSNFTVVKPPPITKKHAAQFFNIMKPATLGVYGCGTNVSGDVFDYVSDTLTATADKKKLREAVQMEIVARRSQPPPPPEDHEGYESATVEIIRTRPKDQRKISPAHSYKTEVLYNAGSTYQTSNESMVSGPYAAEDDLHNTAFVEKPFKAVRIESKPISPKKIETTDSDEISATYYTVEEDLHGKKEAKELHSLRKPTMRSGYRRVVTKSTSPKSTSPRNVSPQSSHAAEDLQNVVQDLNESVSRIIEKSPNEKACREKIAKLEAQLRAALKQKERDVEIERQKRNQEVENLKLTICEMEKALQNKQENAVNLQGAVDLYLNSISVLEQSEERYKNEVTQQRITISNLQEALVFTKHQLDELKEKCQRDLEEKGVLLNILDVSFLDLEKQCYHYYNQYLSSMISVDYLRDEILDLEVEKFELAQDVLVLEARLLKYQQISKLYEGKYLGQECSEYCIKQNESVVTLAQDTICYTEDLQCQLAVLETALKREQKINMVQTNRIEELQSIIGAKNMELSRVNDAYQDVKSKLDGAISRSKTLEDSVQELQEQLKEMELDNMYQEEKSDICHGELDICLNNLQSVKFKLRSQYKAMCQKMQEFTKLQADCKIHANNAEVFKRDLENTRIRCRDEIIELKHNIRDLKEKLNNSEEKIETLNKEVKHSQALLVEASHHETKIKQDFHTREKQLTEKVHSAQEEEMRLLDVVTQLEQQIVTMKNDLDSKGVQLESAKQTILQMNSDALSKHQVTQEEINKLKNEVNTLLQQQGAQKADNERLLQQIECMKCCVRKNESDNQSLRQELEKCVNDLRNAEQEKVYLEQRNTTLMGTLDKMQATIQAKTDNMAHMEFELLEARTSRDEICTESRNVVFNVRSWLEEQKSINEQLKEKLEKKNQLIAKYEQERRKGKCSCCPRSNYPRQRGGSLQGSCFENNAPPLSRSPWSLDSRGSGSDSPTSSVSSTAADWYEYEEVGYDAIIEEPTAELWIHRVESMTEELQRSNRYWKRKINDSEFMVTKDK